MNLKELANIKERNEKVYLVADENMHKVLSPLKQDIKYLLELVDKMAESYYKEHRDIKEY